MDIRSVDPGDIGRSFDIRSRAFGIAPASARAGWEAQALTAIDEGRSVGAYDGELLVGRAMLWPFRQWWGGRVVPMAGVAGVVVSPEYRGRGVGTALMQGIAERAQALGYRVSALYPATVPVYRRLGWELAGIQNRVTVETRLLRDLRGGGPTVRQAGPDDAATMLEITRAHHAEGRANGPREETEAEVREELADDAIFAYLADDGFVVYGWEGEDLVVYELQAGDAATARALWSVVGSGSSIAKNVYAYLAPDDPVHWLLEETVARDVQHTRWMLRCIDVSAAIAGRGYPAGTTVDVALVIADEQLPDNAIAGRLRVSEGRGRLVPGAAEADAVHLGSNGMAALYAGTAVSTLVGSGLVRGGDREALSMLDAAFSGRPAYMLGYF
jgi:predicted acetyltransferase